MYQPYDILGFILFDEANSKLSSVAGLALDHVSVVVVVVVVATLLLLYQFPSWNHPCSRSNSV